MAEKDLVLMSRILYWCRERFYHAMLMEVEGGLMRYNNDDILKYFSALATLFEEQIQPAIRQLETLKDKRDVNICSLLALVHAHKRCKTVDKEAIQTYDSRLKDERKQAGEVGLYLGGLFLIFVDRADKAREYIDRMLKMKLSSSTMAQGLTARGWIEISSAKDDNAKRPALRYFEEALNAAPNYPEAMLARARCLADAGDIRRAVDTCNQLIVTHQDFLAGLIEKTKLAFCTYDWDQVMDTAQRCVQAAASGPTRGCCIEAQRFLVLPSLCRDGDAATAAQQIGQLQRLMDKFEPRNPALYCQTAALFSRLCGRNEQVLEQTCSMVERALQLATEMLADGPAATNGAGTPLLAAILHELGYQLLMRSGRTRDALKCFRNALKHDETCIDALAGIIECQLLEGQLEEAGQQLEMLREFQLHGAAGVGSGGGSSLEPDSSSATMGLAGASKQTMANIAYLMGLLAAKQAAASGQSKPRSSGDGADDPVAQHFETSVRLHFESLKNVPMGVAYLVALNPDLLVRLAEQFLALAPAASGAASLGDSDAGGSAGAAGGAPKAGGAAEAPWQLAECQRLLENVTRMAPGLLHSLFLVARVKFLMGDFEAARATLQACIAKQPDYPDAHVLLAQIALELGDLAAADQNLEVGVSYNFQVRKHPVYHLIRSRIARRSGQPEQSIKLLQAALQLPGVRRATASGSVDSDRDLTSDGQSLTARITLKDRANVFLELADIHLSQNNQHEAAKVLQDALNEFRGTSEELRVVIANAQLAVARDSIDEALAMLRDIGPSAGAGFLVEARRVMANIYLMQRKDRRLYVACYRQLADQLPNTLTQLLLADAYMRVQQPDKAIEVYEGVLKKNPRDTSVASKIGQALVKTHHYSKAVSYYEAAVRSGGQTALRYDLANLLLRLKQLDKAEKVLRQGLSQGGASGASGAPAATFLGTGSSSALEQLMDEARLLLLLAQVQRAQNRPADDCLQTLLAAKDCQARVMKRVSLEMPDAVAAQQRVIAAICCRLAAFHLDQQQPSVSADQSGTAPSAAAHLDSAVRLYRESLQYKESLQVMLQLAAIFMQTDRLDECEQICKQLMNDRLSTKAGAAAAGAATTATPLGIRTQAVVMMADLTFRRGDCAAAVQHLTALLTQDPANYEALARLADLLRRDGRLSDQFEGHLQAAVRYRPQAELDAGYNFSYGLFHWYLGNSTSALEFFNKARLDARWGYDATCNMIEICLNPDGQTIGGQVFDQLEMANGGPGAVNAVPPDSDNDKKDQMALKTAERLLKELKPPRGWSNSSIVSDQYAWGSAGVASSTAANNGDTRHLLLPNMWLIATRQKANVDKSISELTRLAAFCAPSGAAPGAGGGTSVAAAAAGATGAADEDSLGTMGGELCAALGVGAAYGVAVGLMVQRQGAKAKTFLKRAVRANWQLASAEYLERSWLLLADLYVQAQKFDMAVELLSLCLHYNRSCAKAYEYLGHITEKQQNFKEAAKSYEQAWRFSGRQNPAVGYKLAYNCMKVKRYTDAIEICHHILKNYPQYPKIRKEILDKARSCLRV